VMATYAGQEVVAVALLPAANYDTPCQWYAHSHTYNSLSTQCELVNMNWCCKQESFEGGSAPRLCVPYVHSNRKALLLRQLYR
jgi:hypothetical protein